MLLKLRNFFLVIVKDPKYLFVLVSLPAIVVFVIITPPAWGLDEQVHIARAYQISEGNLYPDNLANKGHFGGTLPQSLVDVLNYGHHESNSVDRSEPFFVRQDVRDGDHQKTLEASSLMSDERSMYDFGATGPYSPIVYAPSALGMVLGKILNLSVGDAVNAARFLQGVFYVMLGFVALWVIGNSRAKWLIFLVALLPSSIFLAATVNADAYTIGVALVFFAVMVSFYKQASPLSKHQIVLLAGVSGGLALTKPSYGLLAILILFLPRRLFKTKWPKLIPVLIFLGVCILLALTSIKGMPFSDTILMYRDETAKANMGLAEQLRWMLERPLDFLQVLYHTFVTESREWMQSLVGSLGYNSIFVPYPLLILSLIVIVIAGLTSQVPRERVTQLFAWTSLLSIIAVIVILYATFNTVGSDVVKGVQGRYFIPCIAFLLYGMAYFLPLSGQVRRLRFLYISTAILVLYFTVYAYWKALY